jgi:DNA-binding transcriptional MerR regulator
MTRSRAGSPQDRPRFDAASESARFWRLEQDAAMPTKVTDDHSPKQPQPPAGNGSDAVPRRGRRAVAPRSIDLFEDEHPGVSRLYTVAMMADVLRVPRSAVRHWLRGGLLDPARRAGSIEWFEFPQLVVGRQLVRLLNAGFSLRDIDTKLAELAPGGGPAAARMAERIVADGRRLSILQDDRLVGPGGQLQLGFYTSGLTETIPPPDAGPTAAQTILALPAVAAGSGAAPADGEAPELATVAELLDLAADLEAAGALTEAAEALRAVLQAQGPTAQVVFMLAELLYRMGDLTAARERYYAAVELDAEHLEARSSLGCVLAELGEHELALAALDGVLRQQPDYADAHWHVAGVLHDMGRPAESRRHLQTFLALAPESPWATMAREKLAAADRV